MEFEFHHRFSGTSARLVNNPFRAMLYSVFVDKNGAMDAVSPMRNQG